MSYNDIGSITLSLPWLCYFGLVALFQFAIRALMCFLRTMEIVCQPSINKEGTSRREVDTGLGRNFWKNFRADFLSSHPSELIRDYWHPSIIGFLELAIYPLLIATSNWYAIGGWIAVKTAIGWRGWDTNCTSYNRFLIGNGLVVSAALLLAIFVIHHPGIQPK